MKDERIKVLYILGGGHSGSTVLSLIIGAAPEVINAGELKFYSRHSDRNFSRWKEVENRCTCGEEAVSCPFWAEVEKISPDLEIRYQPGICAYLGTILSGSRSYYLDDLVLFKNILQTAAVQFPGAKIILDTSKSLPRYLQLRANPDIDVTAIFLVRDGRGYFNSYRKRHQARSFFWLLQWAGINLFALLHLAIGKDHFYWLSYDRFTREPDKYLKEINQLFSIQIPSN